MGELAYGLLLKLKSIGIASIRGSNIPPFCCVSNEILSKEKVLTKRHGDLQSV